MYVPNLFCMLQLIGQSMMDAEAYKPVGWGSWDDEIDDRKVDYMVGFIEGRYKFKKSE